MEANVIRKAPRMGIGDIVHTSSNGKDLYYLVARVYNFETQVYEVKLVNLIGNGVLASEKDTDKIEKDLHNRRINYTIYPHSRFQLDIVEI